MKIHSSSADTQYVRMTEKSIPKRIAAFPDRMNKTFREPLTKGVIG